MDGSPSSVISLGFGSWGSSGLTLTLGFGVGAAVVDPATLYGWLEARCTGRLHALAKGHLKAVVTGRLHANADSEE